MCVTWNGDWKEAKSDINAYKIVEKTEDGTYRSPLPPDRRAQQDIGSSAGDILIYKKGETVKSESPGIYLLAMPINVLAPQVVLRVKIPKGTKIRHGEADLVGNGGGMIRVSTINAMAIVVGDERPNEPTSWTMPSSSTAGSSIVWSYVNAATTDITTTYSQGGDSTV